MRALRIVFCVLSLALPWMLCAQVETAWVALYDGGAYGDEEPHDLCIDAQGNVYVTGEGKSLTNYYSDILTVKYDSSGQEVWVARYNGPGNEDDAGSAIAVDAQGNVYVAGGAMMSYYDGNACLIKYSPDGQELWVILPGDSLEFQSFCDLAVEAEGFVYVTGALYTESSVGTYEDYWTLKFDGNGGQLWAAQYTGIGEHVRDEARALALDTESNVYVTGFSEGNDSPYSDYFDIATVKYNADGEQQWEARYTNGEDDFGWDVAVDIQGYVYVAGYSRASATDEDWVTLKYDALGTESWAQRYDGPGHDEDEAYALVVNPAGEVYVAGYGWGGNPSQGGTSDDFTTVKYSSSGVQQWVAVYADSQQNVDQACDIAIDNDGCVYTTGYLHQPWSNYYTDIATIKYNPSGQQQWIMIYSGAGNGNDQARRIAVDPQRSVYVLGRAQSGTPTGYDFVTMKYSQAEIAVILTPSNPPIQIPVGGGSFEFTIEVRNLNSIQPNTFDVWCDVTLPDGSSYGPTLGPVTVTAPPGFTTSRVRTQSVPASAPVGIYYYSAYVGTYPDSVGDQDNFFFIKLPLDDGTRVGEWSNSGEEFGLVGIGGGSTPALQPGQFGISVSPNPFNPATTLSFTLPEAGAVRLEVFDVRGREAGAVGFGESDLQYSAGSHEIIFDGSGLPSGVYLYRLEVSGSGTSPTTVTGKMVLMK